MFYETDVRDLACKWHLKQSCSKFYKLQKLCWWLFMKMLGTHSNLAHKAKIRADSTLSQIFPKSEATQFRGRALGSFVEWNPGRIRFWSCKQSCRTRVASGFSHCRRRLNRVIQFRQSPAGRHVDDPWRPYVDGDPACQPRRLHLDATTPPRASAVLISPAQRSLPSPFRLGELRRGTTASPELPMPPPAKPAHQKLR